MHSLADRSIEREIEVAEARPFMMCLSLDGSRLGMTYSGGAAVYSTGPFERIGAATTKVKGMYGVAFSPDGSLLAAASADGKTRVWRATVSKTDSCVRIYVGLTPPAPCRFRK